MSMLLIDKPAGISSFGVVAAVRRATGVKKVGHAGTLDPLATGLLLVLVGKEETRQAQRLLGLDKSYETVIRLGERRNTGDLEGDIVSCERNMPVIASGKMQKILKDMIGTHTLPVPQYSAVKCNGQRLYTCARKGHDVHVPLRDMHVYDVQYSAMQEVILWSDDGNECWRGYEVQTLFTVASGVYIRSLSEAFGQRLGYPATTAGLRRISIGAYNIANAQSLASIKAGMLRQVPICP